MNPPVLVATLAAIVVFPLSAFAPTDPDAGRSWFAGPASWWSPAGGCARSLAAPICPNGCRP
jgi:hypothetical protein